MNILFTSTNVSSFISEDLKILGKHFHVTHVITRGLKAFAEIPGSVLRNDVTFTWFASVYAWYVFVVAKLMGKKSIVVIGGSDVANYPEINYGIFLSSWRSVLVGFTLRHAHRILSVDPFIERQAKLLARYNGENIRYVPTGYDATMWTPLGKKEAIVLNVSACDTVPRLKQKGLDILLRCARILSDVRFVIIGVSARALEILSSEASSNVELISYRQRHELLPYFQNAKVYCQPSLFDGLPNSLCEAMLCECIPVGADAGGIPTAIRDPDYLVAYGDVEGLSKALRRALAAPPSVGVAARRYIAETFPLKRREEALVRLMNEIRS